MCTLPPGRPTKNQLSKETFMRSRRTIATFAMAFVALSAVGASFALADGGRTADKATQIGQLVRSAIQGSYASAVNIDGVDVNEATLRVFEAPYLAEGKSQADARAAAIAAFARQMVLKSEFSRRQITVSDAEVDAFVASWRAREAGAGTESVASANAYLQARGQTADDYWASEAVRGVARYTISRNKLGAQIAPGVADAEAIAAVERLVDDLVRNVVIRNAR
jgi:hypothetical protein